MASSFRHDRDGAALIEFTLVFPIVLLIVLGVVDVTLLMIDWSSYNRATYAGARIAAVSNPVAMNINAAIAGTSPGDACIDPSSGVSTGNCTARNAATCVATGVTSGGNCTGGYSFSDAALNNIVTEMKKSFSNLDRRQVSVTYTPIMMGYVGRPDGFPMNVTVSIRCVQHQFYFLQSLMGWTMPSPPAACNGIAVPTGVVMPAFATTLPSEDLQTN